MGVGRTVVGKTHDTALLGEDPPPFGRWYEGMCSENTPKDERFEACMDPEYHGIKKRSFGGRRSPAAQKAKDEQGGKGDPKADRETKKATTKG